MAKSAVCPYYGCNEDVCDVGCGYISSHDASQISRYCSADYEGCPKLSELLARDAGGLAFSPTERVTLQRNPLAFIRGESGVAFGLSATGLAILVYTLHKFGLFGESVHFSGSLIMLIAAVQIVIGMITMKKLPVRGLMFVGSGLLWASILAMELLPAAGYGASPGKYALSGYFYLWGLFCLFPLQAAVRVSLHCRLFFGLFAVYLLLQAIAPYFMFSFDVATLLVGCVASLVGMGAGVRYLLRFGEHEGDPLVSRI